MLKNLVYMVFNCTLVGWLRQFTVVDWLRIFVVFLDAGSPGPLLSMVTGVLTRSLYPSIFINQTIWVPLDTRRSCNGWWGGRRVNAPSPGMFTAEGSHDLCVELCFSALSHSISCFIFKGGKLVFGPLWNIQGTLAMFRIALSYKLMRPLMCLCVCFGPDPRCCPVSYSQWGWRVGRVSVYLGGPHLSWTRLLCWLGLQYASPFLIGLGLPTRHLVCQWFWPLLLRPFGIIRRAYFPLPAPTLAALSYDWHAWLQELSDQRSSQWPGTLLHSQALWAGGLVRICTTRARQLQGHELGGLFVA